MKASYGKIDLHLHTDVSDGTDTPEELLGKIREAGIGLFSVTDHDTIACCQRIRGILTKEDPHFLTGVEFSCRDGEGKYHILGYGYDSEAEPICSAIEAGHRFRMQKLRDRLDCLREKYEISFPEDALEWLFSRNNPGKPHIAVMMVKYGYADSVGEAIRTVLDTLPGGTEYIGPKEAIEAIRKSGGIPILAHPAFGSGSQMILGEDLECRVRRLMEFGLAGLEGFYSGFSAEIREECLGIAERYGLYVTAGSDYHGRNKEIPLGDTGLDGIRDWPEGLLRFLRDTVGKTGRFPASGTD